MTSACTRRGSSTGSRPATPSRTPKSPFPSGRPRNKARKGPSAFVKHQEISYQWELAPLKLPVGTVITFYADARDFDTLKGPNIGKSREIRLRIVSKEDAARQFDDARRELREEIARVLTMQKQAITPVDNAIRTLSQTDRLPAKDRDDFNNAGDDSAPGEQAGSTIATRGSARGSAACSTISANFKIDNADAQKQMEDMLARLGVIRDQHLGPAEQGLTRATKSLDRERRRTVAARSTRCEAARIEAGRLVERGPDEVDTTPPPSARSAKSKADVPAEQAADGEAESRPRPRGQRTSRDSRQGEQSKGARPPRGARPRRTPPRPTRSPRHRRRLPPKPGTESTQLALAESKTNQKAIADELQKMLDGLSEFETYRGVVKDAQELLKQHEQTMKQTDEAAAKPETMGKPLDALEPRTEGGPGQPGFPAVSGRQGPAKPAGAHGRDGRPAQ